MTDPKEIKAEIMKHTKEITKLALGLPKAYGSEGFHLTIDMIIHDGEIRGGIKAAPFDIGKDGNVVYKDTDDKGNLVESGHKNKSEPEPEEKKPEAKSPEKIVDDLLKKLLGGK